MNKKDIIKNIIIIILLVVVIIQSNPLQHFIMTNIKGDKVFSQQMHNGTIVGYNDPSGTVFRFFLIVDEGPCLNLDLAEDADLVMPAETEKAFKNREYFGRARVYCTITYKDFEAGILPASSVISLD